MFLSYNSLILPVTNSESEPLIRTQFFCLLLFTTQDITSCLDRQRKKCLRLGVTHHPSPTQSGPV